MLSVCILAAYGAEPELNLPFGFIDSLDPIVWQRENAVRGWALSKNGPVSISVLAQGVEIVSVQVGDSRGDVAAAYPDYPLALNAGFGVIVPFEKLPRGRYSLTIELTDTHAAKSVLVGPEVINDTPIANIDTREPITRHSKNILRGWFAGTSGKVRLQLGRDEPREGELKAIYPRPDVRNYFVAWLEDGLDFQGFDQVLSFRQLPRGRYPLQISLLDDHGAFYHAEGPLVENDLPIGRVISPTRSIATPGVIEVRAWVADEDGIGQVWLVDDDGKPLVEMPVSLEDVSYEKVREAGEALRGEPDPAVKMGQLHLVSINTNQLSKGVHRVFVQVTDRSGRTNRLPGPLVVDTDQVLPVACKGEVLRILMPADTQQFRDGFRLMNQLKETAAGGCVEVGIRGRVEYLRTTKGADHDFEFDPEFPDSYRVRGEQSMTTTALGELLRLAKDWQVPLLVTLDGGPWADARFPAADLDVVDYLEKDDLNVQWNQFGRAEQDDALSNLPGSYGSPQLARMMTLNHFNQRYRHYKKRNLQAAAKVINTSDAVRQGLYVKVSLDPDQYINPWFYKTQWYDYNPDTLRQFRQWLTHTGLYTERGELFGRGYQKELKLGEINELAKKDWKKLEEVEPDRAVPDYANPWHQIWTQFKRHLVGQHFNDLADWLVETGMDDSQIYSSQTFIQTDIAATVDSPASGWTDEAGVSMAGAKPDKGRLGAILYGPSSRDEGMIRGNLPLFATIRNFDPSWGVVELHPATIELPEYLPSHSESYQTMGQILNAGATFISPMWGGHAADQMTYPRQFKSYDAFIGTDFEYQLVWWLLQRRDIPVGSLLYPFGNRHVSSDDGWAAVEGTLLKKLPGYLELETKEQMAVLESPYLDQLFSGKRMTLNIQGRWPEQYQLEWALISDGKDVLYQTLDYQPNILAPILFPAEYRSGKIRLRWKNRDQDVVGKIFLDKVSLVETPELIQN